MLAVDPPTNVVPPFCSAYFHSALLNLIIEPSHQRSYFFLREGGMRSCSPWMLLWPLHPLHQKQAMSQNTPKVFWQIWKRYASYMCDWEHLSSLGRKAYMHTILGESQADSVRSCLASS